MKTRRDIERLVLDVFRRLKKVHGIPRWEPAGPATDELVLTILSQHTNDKNRDRAYQALRRDLPTWAAVAKAPVERVAADIRRGGLANQKSRRIQEILRRLHAERGDYSLEFLREMPIEEARAYLQAIPGVGPKTAACVLLFCWGKPVFPVDTHILRVTQRLGWIPTGTTAERAHERLGALAPAKLVYPLHILLIWHGRDTCHAQRPECARCPLLALCPHGQATLRARVVRRAGRADSARRITKSGVDLL